ncbi:DoxX family protein [Gordonia sp. NPDC003424]
MSSDRFAPQKLARGLAVMLLSIGTLHFVAPKPFDEIIPEEIPADPRTLTYASGAAELAIGAGLLAPRTRRASGALAAALFVAVYPANINMVRLWWGKGTAARVVAIGRLPFQFPMIWAALKVARAQP